VTVAVVAVALGALAVGVALGWLIVSRYVSRQIATLRGERPTRQNLGDSLSDLSRSVGQLRSSSARAAKDVTVLRSALDGLSLGVVLFGAAPDDSWRNKAAQELLSSARVEALLDEALVQRRALAIGGAAGSQMVEVVGPPMRTYWLTSVPLPLVDGLAAGVVTISDLSDLVRLERVRREFVANVSHELRTPVGAIAVLAETLESEDDQTVINRLALKLVAEAHRLSRTITDLLELSVLESSGRAQRQQLDASSLVAEAISRVAPTAAARNITLDATGVDAEHRATGDSAQLISALGNLVENAVKYSDGGGAVSIATSVDAGQIIFTVSDRGVGIPSRDLDRVFERFYRVDTARSRITGGTGLGLAIVRHVAENHNGTVSVESTEGKGSTFELVIPNAPNDRNITAKQRHMNDRD
jgi:two-component system, OmpR family, sensor histidine kinase SenX3